MFLAGIFKTSVVIISRLRLTLVKIFVALQFRNLFTGGIPLMFLRLQLESPYNVFKVYTWYIPGICNVSTLLELRNILSIFFVENQREKKYFTIVFAHSSFTIEN